MTWSDLSKSRTWRAPSPERTGSCTKTRPGCFSPPGQTLKNVIRFPFRHPQMLCGLVRPEGPDEKKGDELCLLLAEEHLENTLEQLRRRGPLGEPVEPLDPFMTLTSGTMMGHRRTPGYFIAILAGSGSAVKPRFTGFFSVRGSALRRSLHRYPPTEDRHVLTPPCNFPIFAGLFKIREAGPCRRSQTESG